MPKHIVRLTLLIVAGVVLAYAAKQLFTADSFYLYGHYRGKSVAEIAVDKPKFNTPKFCEQCHAVQYAEWSKSVHNSPDSGKVVKCEVCHGAAGDRDFKSPYVNASTGKDHPNGLKMAVPTETAKLCTLCHEQMPGRPAQQRQIVVATHAGTQQCATCHNPHSPRTFKVAAAAKPKGDAAAGKTIAAACAGCHGEAGVGGNVSGPSLAGQKAGYLADALKAYKTGGRADPVMTAMVKDLGDADIENVAAYFAGSKCKSVQNADKKALAAGHAVAAKCATCHGAKGISGQPAWPNLAGQSKNYLVNALKSYKAGGRKNGMMDGIAKDLSDADAASVAAYYSNASCR
jgi:cytochrome c553